MKLDFLKRGVINTANFIPKFAFGDMNMHPAVLVINIIGRLLAVYLCFQFKFIGYDLATKNGHMKMSYCLIEC